MFSRVVAALGRQAAVAAPVGAAAGAASVALGSVALADEAEHGLAAPAYPWSHSGAFAAYDAASIRRGHQVCRPFTLPGR